MAYNPRSLYSSKYTSTLYMFVIPCLELRLCGTLKMYMYEYIQSRNLFVLNFYFAPSLNLIDIIRRKMHYVQQILLYRKNCLDMSHTASN